MAAATCAFAKRHRAGDGRIGISLRPRAFTLRCGAADETILTMSNFFAPIHPDGWKFVALFTLATILLFVLVPPSVDRSGATWCAYFFRDPWRVTPLRAGLMVSPADGRVLSIAPGCRGRARNGLGNDD